MNKKILYSIALLAGVLTGLPSCSDDYADPPVNEPTGGIGTGAWDNPMTASQARLGTINYQINPAWVRGYIVGVIDTDESTVLNDKSADFIPPFNIETNMLIADDPAPFQRLNELSVGTPEFAALRDSLIEVVATVQLPSAMRNRLGLVSNPSALYEQVCIQGTTGQTYCGEYGVRSPLDYNIGDKGKEPGAEPAVEATGKFYQNFTAATAISALETLGWTNLPTEGNLVGWQVVVGEGNNYIATDAFNGFSGGGPYEHWLITPPIALDQLGEKTLEFESAAMTQAAGSTIEVYAMSSADPATATLTKLNATFAQAPAKGYSDWISSGKIDLSGFNGTIYIGWKYRAERGGFGNSVTYCLDNINVGNCPAPADWTKASDFLTLLDPSAETGYDGWQTENVLMTGGLSYVWGWKSYSNQYYLNASAFFHSTNNPALSYTYYPNVDLSGYQAVGVSFEHAAKFQTTLPGLGRVVVREVGQSDWTEYQIPAWPEAGSWTFANSGIIEISEFAGKNIEIGFKYESNEAGADQWEIRSMILTGIKK